jgi:hypothetical protein
MIDAGVSEITGLKFDPAEVIDRAGIVPDQVIASIPDANTKFGIRYGSGRDEKEALTDLLLNATGRHAAVAVGLN